ncbi:hypothetical protein BX600DRAFT_507939 [Xylariales sp. PMI_506]|nr:hypothetical protein BX600DRAFT_507939 [Xylariales sp. PMI_506]
MGNIKRPDLQETLGSVLPSLPPASFATEPPESILPYLSPILRQRVQLLSSSSTEAWIRLLCYDTAKAARLVEIAQSDRLEPHPVSGEVEVDWDYDAEVRYRRLDEETLQALVVLSGMELSFRLVYCIGDQAGDGWKVGEVSVADAPSPFSSFGGVTTIDEADRQFKDSQAKKAPSKEEVSSQHADDDDDDDYWARYDATPARTPAQKVSPAPRSISGAKMQDQEDDYYAQYDQVQPAMDNYDPDEEHNLPDIAPPLGFTSHPAVGGEAEDLGTNETNGAWTLAEATRSPSVGSRNDDDDRPIVHPRPSSSASSNASVAKLEAAAENFGVQQHISRSIKSLYMLSRASGIERAEFELLVKRELEMLKLMED